MKTKRLWESNIYPQGREHYWEGFTIVKSRQEPLVVGRGAPAQRWVSHLWAKGQAGPGKAQALTHESPASLGLDWA